MWLPCHHDQIHEIIRMKDLKRLLEKFDQGLCTVSELERLRQYFEADDLTALRDLLEGEWQATESQQPPISHAKSRKLWQQIMAARRLRGRTARVRTLRLVAVAASLLALVSIAVWHLLPLALDDSREIVVINSGALPMELQLDDGSEVWLRQGSQMAYRQPFVRDRRQIQLQGEAFFDVATDSLRPFAVVSGPVQTLVYGTAFNVKASQEDTVVTITLVEGEVGVHSIGDGSHPDTTYLQAGEQLTFRKISKKLDKSQVFHDRDYVWKDNIIHFDGASAQEVAVTLSTWYDIDIRIPDGFSSKSRLVHRFDRKKLSVQEVQEGISQVTDYYFEKLKEGIYVLRRDIVREK